MSRPGLWVATGQACAAARATKCSCAHDMPAVRAATPTTWALRAQCMRDMVSGCAHCAHNLVL